MKAVRKAPASVIFLDADGVFAALLGMFALDVPDLADVYGVNRGCVKLLTLLARRTNSVFVVSSTWRYAGREAVLDKLVNVGFNRMDFHPSDPCTGEPGSRIGEICEWLERHPEVKRHLVVDDEKMENNEGVPLRIQSVQVDSKIGFTIYDFNKACILFGRPELEWGMPPRRNIRSRRPNLSATP